VLYEPIYGAKRLCPAWRVIQARMGLYMICSNTLLLRNALWAPWPIVHQKVRSATHLENAAPEPLEVQEHVRGHRGRRPPLVIFRCGHPHLGLFIKFFIVKLYKLYSGSDNNYRIQKKSFLCLPRPFLGLSLKQCLPAVRRHLSLTAHFLPDLK
jgi:hypothetical protein